MPVYWLALNITAAALQLAIGVTAIAKGRFWEARCWHAACFLYAPPLVWWIVSQGHRNRSPYYPLLLGALIFVRIIITIEAIDLLLWKNYAVVSIPKRLAWYAGLSLASVALLNGVSWQGHARIMCATAMAIAVVAYLRNPELLPPQNARHAGLLMVWLMSEAFASAAGSRAGDGIDVTATGVQVACYVVWLSDLFRRSGSPRGSSRSAIAP